MYSTCLFCTTDLGRNDVVEHFPVGRKLAFDSLKGRLWVVCGQCHRWNLTPIEERLEAIDQCERLFRGTFVRVSTDNIGLAKLKEGLELIRIGEPLLPEFAAWRYGPQFLRRRNRSLLVGSTTVAAAGLAATFVGAMIGPALTTGVLSIVVIPGITTVGAVFPIVGALAANDYMENDRVVARFAQKRRVLTVRAKHVGDVEFHVGDGGTASLAFPHDRGWATLTDTAAIHAAGVILANSNRDGASRTRVRDAVREIEDQGNAAGFLRSAARRNGWRGGRIQSVLNRYRGIGAIRLGPTERLAFERAVHEETERRALHGELAVLESAWRDAEQIAAICDEQLT
jgi:hypothetical protein